MALEILSDISYECCIYLRKSSVGFGPGGWRCVAGYWLLGRRLQTN